MAQLLFQPLLDRGHVSLKGVYLLGKELGVLLPESQQPPRVPLQLGAEPVSLALNAPLQTVHLLRDVGVQGLRLLLEGGSGDD